MEDYGNEVINSHAIYSRLLVNLLVKLTRMNPRLGGAIGAAPQRASRGRIRPRRGVPRAMGLLPTQSLAGQPREPWAPWHPFGGGNTVARGSLGGEWLVNPGVPL